MTTEKHRSAPDKENETENETGISPENESEEPINIATADDVDIDEHNSEDDKEAAPLKRGPLK